MSLYDIYDFLFVKLGDKRVEKWYLMKDPFNLLAIIGVYLYAIYHYLPNYMKNRKAYDLKLTIQVYNIVQVIACIYLIQGMLTSGWLTTYSMGCEPVDFSYNTNAIRMLGFVYWTFILKIVELVETCFFILRHKQNQVTTLHVYHHCSTLSIAWFTTKYMGGGMVTFAIIVNCMIHVIMYTYYFLATFGTRFQTQLAWIKPKITIMQMVQFCILVIHSLHTFRPGCKHLRAGGIIFIPNLLFLFRLFYNFYKKSYTSSKTRIKVKAT